MTGALPSRHNGRMIAYDLVLEGLPERVRELTVRLRDLVLSLGAGVTEHVSKDRLEFTSTRRFCVMQPDRTGVSLVFPSVSAPLHDDPKGRLSVQGKQATLRLASASDIDDSVRTICRQALQQASTTSKPGRAASAEELDEQLTEALRNVSRGLRLLVHHIQSTEKAAQQRALSQARQGQKRSHKKKPPQAPPPLPLPPVEEQAAKPEIASRPSPRPVPKKHVVKKKKRAAPAQKPAAKKKAMARRKAAPKQKQRAKAKPAPAKKRPAKKKTAKPARKGRR